ncbi:unnamed protein product [Ceratitis capitata]|uniref:(Mediterranean fruit fly) hypothetical protein n=1 Tax=Ceratitis capitata TaxID=7213 RepID=A0A811V8A9_CERCA|nr:unnamed protein product [Ceratitis capitata]
MGMIVRYLFDSFKSPLPWTVCDDAWNETCVASGTTPTPEPLSNYQQKLVKLTSISDEWFVKGGCLYTSGIGKLCGLCFLVRGSFRKYCQ